MDVRRGLMFSKCFCCGKNYNVLMLMGLKTEVVVGDETLNFEMLLLDVCLLMVDPVKKSLICADCQNQLVFFHMFKRDLKKYSSLKEVMGELVILAKVDDLLKEVEDVSELLVFQRDNAIVISNAYEDEDTDEQDLVKHEEFEIIIEEAQMAEAVEEYIEEPVGKYEIPQESIESFQEPVEMSQAVLVEEVPQAENETDQPKARTKRQKSRKYNYPVNTNDQMTEKEKAWVNQQVRECEVNQDGKTFYQCSKCDTCLQIPGSLKKHLRDVHLLKSAQDQQDWNSRKAFKDEIRQSKMIIMTSNGSETIWKCQRCESHRVFRSEPGLKVHIRYSHIRNQVIDAKFIAQCRLGQRAAWKCPQCSKILKSRDTLRNHLKIEHPESVESTMEANSILQVGSNEKESLMNLLERKRRTLKSEVTSVCEECGIQFINGTSKREKSSRIHQECHKILNVVSQFYQLPKCDISKTMFIRDEDLENYLQSDQRLFDPIPCDGMSAKVSQKIKDPLGTADRDGDAWKCGHCGVKYETETDCTAHCMILHSKRLICPVDNLEFEGNRGTSQFNIHMRNKHHEMFPDFIISCTYCSQQFNSIFEKLAHMKNCNEKKFNCDHCGRKYFTKTELTRHLKIVSGEISYTCDICSRSCTSTMDLKLHNASHTHLKAYRCSYFHCDKAFKTPASRSSHMETHSNIKFDCPSCSASFRQRTLYQRHLKKSNCRDPLKDQKNLIMIEEVYEEIEQVYDEN